MTTRTSTETAILLPDSPPIPGLSFRPMDMGADIPALAELISEAHLTDGIDWLPTVDGLRVELEHQPNFVPAQDLLLAELDGTLVGATHHAIRIRDGKAVHEQTCWVQPSARRRGIGRALLHWSESRSREAAAAWSGSEPHVLSSWVDERQAGAIVLLESEGYVRVRYGFMMVRSLADPIADAPLPDGLEVRPVVEADHRQIWDADTEAFRDHWGAMTRTEEDYVGWFAIPEIDTSLWRVAWDGDEVAGAVMPFVFPDENERLGVNRGWLEHISVRRPWRRRGLASALIVDSLRALRERGIEEAALGVDGENVSGALRIYESQGFRRYQTDIAFRKPL
jgi:mycothiol synthase